MLIHHAPLFLHPSFPINEKGRVQALKDYQILYTEKEPAFEVLTELAALVCEVPVAVISLLDEDNQWFKSCIGMEISQTPKSISFCQFAILEKSLFIIEDATLDERFKNNELVTSGQIRFYAGCPLIDPAGYSLGTLCVMDSNPRQITDTQKKALEAIASQVISLIVKRRRNIELQNFENLFNTTDDLLLIVNKEGVFKKVSPSFTRVLGWEKEYFFNTPLIDMIHPDDLAMTFGEIEKIGNGEVSINYVNRYKTKAGDYKFIQWQTNPEPGTDNLFAIGRDITEEKKREALQYESELKFRALFETSQTLICTHNLEGKFLSVNHAGLKMLGYTLDELTEMSLFDLVDRQFHTQLKNYLKEIITTGISAGTMSVTTKNGQTLSWLYNNVLTKPANGTEYVIGNSIDITDRLILERELQRTSELLIQTNKVARIGGWALNTITNKLFWSTVTREILEAEPDYIPLLDSAIQSYKEGESRDLITEAVERAITQGTPWDLELQLITHKNREIWVRALGSAEMIDGKCIRLFGTFQDIDEKKKREQELDKNTKIIEQQNNRLLNFAHIVSHNLRTHSGNLSAIVGLINDETDEKNRQDLFVHITSISTSLNQTIEDLTKVVQILTDNRSLKSLVSFQLKFNSIISSLTAIMKRENAVIHANFSGAEEVYHISAYLESIMFNFISL